MILLPVFIEHWRAILRALPMYNKDYTTSQVSQLAPIFGKQLSPHFRMIVNRGRSAKLGQGSGIINGNIQ